eukprot:2047833-Pyramimonas_sp.AAC.1
MLRAILWMLRAILWMLRVIFVFTEDRRVFLACCAAQARSYYTVKRGSSEASDPVAVRSDGGGRATHSWRNHSRLWRAACAALDSVDPEFADTFSSIAVTKGFSGPCFML